MKKQLRASGGHLVDVIHEFEVDGKGYYTVHHADGGDWSMPFTISVDNPNYTPYDLSSETPEVGDVVAGMGGRGVHFRVIGVTDDYMIVVEKAMWDRGEWKTPKGILQYNPHLSAEIDIEGTVIMRTLPDSYLRVVERP